MVDRNPFSPFVESQGSDIPPSSGPGLVVKSHTGQDQVEGSGNNSLIAISPEEDELLNIDESDPEVLIGSEHTVKTVDSGEGEYKCLRIHMYMHTCTHAHIHM